MTDDTEIEWHIAKNRDELEELAAGTTAGADVFPETQSESERLKAQIAQSELIVAAYETNIPKRLTRARAQGLTMVRLPPSLIPAKSQQVE
jgi:hypothetical protein